MRFLIDAQLPPDLARFLISCGFEAEHVSEVGLITASDGEIWNWAKLTGAVIVTKDADFAALTNLRPGPQVVWLRFRNSRKAELRKRLVPLLPLIVAALDGGDRLVEVA